MAQLGKHLSPAGRRVYGGADHQCGMRSCAFHHGRVAEANATCCRAARPCIGGWEPDSNQAKWIAYCSRLQGDRLRSTHHYTQCVTVVVVVVVVVGVGVAVAVAVGVVAVAVAVAVEVVVVVVLEVEVEVVVVVVVVVVGVVVAWWW